VSSTETGPTGSIDWLLPGAACRQASTFLDAVYSQELALYPFTTHAVDGEYVSDYRTPDALRYTVNTLLGRLRAAKSGADGGVDRVALELAEFTRRYGATLGGGDRGLLLVLLTELEAAPNELGAAVAGATETLDGVGLSRLNLQDLSWLLWGASCAAESGAADAAPLATRLYEQLVRLTSAGPLARHTDVWYRRHLVSFGSTVYFLRALYEYARVFGDSDTHLRFERGVRAALSFQGALGEWPWMLSTRRGHALDVYPVYSVHQLSMAMLFLFPALDEGGIDGVAEAIGRSYRWVLGENQLGIEFGQREPFIIFRSLERQEPLPKLTRFARATVRSAFAGENAQTGRNVRVNREWRSYEAGWLLYAWSGRRDELVA
jgi:hypothetical protein